MSYINNALRKVQKDKESRYTGYEHMVSSPGREPKKPRRWFPIAIILIFILCAAGVTAFFYLPEEKKMSAAPAGVSAPQQVVPAAPVVFARQQPVPNEPAAITPVKTPVSVEAQPDIQKPPAIEKKAENSQAVVNRTASRGPQIHPDKAVTATQTVSIKAAGKDKDQMTDAKTLYAQALKKHQAGNLEEAKKLYKQVLKLDPQNVQALNNLGVVYMKKGVYKWAAIRLNDALTMKPDYADAHYNLACVYAKIKDKESSLLRLKDAIDLNPEIRTWAKADKDLENISDQPLYKKLMEKP